MMSGDWKVPISLLTLLLVVNMPRSLNSISEVADLPFELSLMRMDAVRVYTGGVRSRYATATPRQTMSEITNQCHLARQR